MPITASDLEIWQAGGLQITVGVPGSAGLSITWRGTWSNSTAYALNDAVARTNQSYICVVANTGNDPATDTTRWNLMAAQGGTGATGPPGPSGPSSVSTDANNKATLGSDALILVQGVATGASATTHAQTVSGDDPQLTNARTPIGHALTHKSGGSDSIALDTLAAPTDLTTLNASTSAHGLLRKLDNTSTHYLDGTGAWSTPPVGAPTSFISKTAAYTLTSADSGKYVICSSGSWTLTLPAAAAGLTYWVRNDQGITGTTGTITIAAPSGTVDGASALALLAAQECLLACDGTNWRSFGRNRHQVLGTLDLANANNGILLLPPGYRCFRFELCDLSMMTDQDAVQCQVSFDGGTTWYTSGNYYENVISNNTATGVIATAYSGTTFFYLSAAQYGGSSLLNGDTSALFYPGDSANGVSLVGNSTGYYTGLGLTSWFFGGAINVGNGRANALKYYAAHNIRTAQMTVVGIV